MTRVDLYGAVHKAIRALLFEAMVHVGRTEFTDAVEREEAILRVRRLLGFLEEHAEHEDEVLLPEFAAIAPELHAQLQLDHARIDGLQREVAGILGRLPGAYDLEQVSLGVRLRERLTGLVVEHLEHMGREETAGNRALWAHRTDEDLRALHGRIVGSIQPERLAEWFAAMLPVLGGPERRELVGGLHAAVPPAAFRSITDPARADLGEPAWSELLAACGIAPSETRMVPALSIGGGRS